MKTIKLVILGDSSIGKSCLILRYKNDLFDENQVSTIGVEFVPKTIVIDDKDIKLHIWDLSGQEKFYPITSSYYRNAHGILLAFDLTNMESFKNLNRWMKDIYKLTDDPAMVLIGTKLDLKDKRQVRYEDAKKFAENNNINYYEISSKENLNISTLFLDITKNCIIKEDDKDKNITLEIKKNKKCCYY